MENNQFLSIDFQSPGIGITFKDASLADIPAPDYILGPLQAGDIGIISGADGSGKSLTALAMGASVAFGASACGVVDAPRAGSVLYIAGEDRDEDHLRRMQRLEIHLQEIGCETDARAANFKLFRSVAVDAHS